ncbi:MAG TPA: EamA family transporter [Acidimicrobiaceae bacterium]|nr:EamA family transporter [Acidimicrobiaceae bacterium]HCB37178.1 EamA family transporter [Acidimicrobiaceae bacterium]
MSLSHRVPPEALFALGGVSQYLGAAVAVELFDRLAPGGVALLRVLGAAAVIVVWRRSWRRSWTRADLAWAVAFGSTLALMNLSIYVAIAELPLGNAVALEFLGPIVVAAAGARSARSLLSVAVALAGVVVLAGLQAGGTGKGVAFALAAGGFWAGYIVLGHRVARRGLSVDGLGVGMLAGALVIAPFGAGEMGAALASPAVLALALATGVASNVIPYGIDQVVMGRISRTRFALLQSLLPVTAAVVGFVLLSQRPTAADVAGIGLVIAAIALSSRDRRADAAHHGTPA